MKKLAVLIMVVGILSGGVVRASTLFDTDLSFGMQNNADIAKLQEFLADQKLYTGPITGNFYSLTLRAVSAFQRKEGIVPAAGYFGLKTRARANELLGDAVNASDNQAIAETGSKPVVTAEDLQKQISDLLAQVKAIQEQQLAAQNQTNQILNSIQNSKPVSVVPAPAPARVDITPPEIQQTVPEVATITIRLIDNIDEIKTARGIGFDLNDPNEKIYQLTADRGITINKIAFAEPSNLPVWHGVNNKYWLFNPAVNAYSPQYFGVPGSVPAHDCHDVRVNYLCKEQVSGTAEDRASAPEQGYYFTADESPDFNPLYSYYFQIPREGRLLFIDAVNNSDPNYNARAVVVGI